MKKILLFTLVSIGVIQWNTLMAQTEGDGSDSYGLSIAGIVVTPDNASNITTGVTAGKVSYDPNNRILTLNNATIVSERGPGIHNDGVENLTINLVGINKITANNGASIFIWKNTNINGNGTLRAESSNAVGIFIMQNVLLSISGGCTVEVVGEWGIKGMFGTAGETLSIDNATVKTVGAKGSILTIASLVMKGGCQIRKPQGAIFNEQTHCVELNGERVKSEVIISPTDTQASSTLVDKGLLVYTDKGMLYLKNLNNLMQNKVAYIYSVTGDLIDKVLITGEQTSMFLPAGMYVVKVDEFSEKVMVK
ncbi:MAG: hypothetical protein Q4A56_01070 [Porphyromonadaceae bacterium]|nr:hypothetical protein [Porphyromonadaceae bacterium]